MPQINITILKGQAQRPAEGTFPWGAERALPCPDRTAGQKIDLGRRRGRGRWLPWGTEQKHAVNCGEEGILFLRLWSPSKRKGWGQDHGRRSLRAALGLTPPAFAPKASGSRSCEQHITLHSPAQQSREAKRPRVLHPRGPVSAVHLLRESHGPGRCSCCFWINALRCRDFPEGRKKNFDCFWMKREESLRLLDTVCFPVLFR